MGPDQTNPTLESLLLQKATSIGAQPLPEVQEQGMPLPSSMLGGGAKAAGLLSDWARPETMIKRGVNGVADELQRLLKMRVAGQLYHGLTGDPGKYLLKKINQGIDYTLGYDPNAVPVGNPQDASKPTP